MNVSQTEEADYAISIFSISHMLVASFFSSRKHHSHCQMMENDDECLDNPILCLLALFASSEGRTYHSGQQALGGDQLEEFWKEFCITDSKGVTQVT